MKTTASTQLSLRLATEADLTKVHALIRTMAEEMGRLDEFSSRVSDYVEAGSGKRPRFKVVVAEDSGQIIGLCLFFPSWSSWRGTPGVYVQDIYVEKNSRGRGLAARLLFEVARVAGQKGAKFMRLSVDTSNHQARHFYQRLGLKYSDKECIYMALGEEFEEIRNGSASSLSDFG